MRTFTGSLIAAALLFLSPFALATTAPTCVLGKSGIAPTATITFTPPTTNTDGTPITGALTYDLFQGTASGAEKEVATGLTGSPISVNTGLTDGTTIYWYVEAVNSAGVASAPSNEVCKTFPAGTPSAVVISIS